VEVPVVQRVLKVNDELAGQVRERLRAAGAVAVNIISAPGSGKTTLIETVLPLLRDRVRVGVIEGDPETSLDAERISQHDVPVVQIETAGGCHLEANLVNRALDSFSLEELDLVLIENVGNLVCPAAFDLGESARVAIVSVPEGHDKPAKYPRLFKDVDLVILNKTDLLPYIPFDRDLFKTYLDKLQPGGSLIETACPQGQGVQAWADWLASVAEGAPARKA